MIIDARQVFENRRIAQEIRDNKQQLVDNYSKAYNWSVEKATDFVDAIIGKLERGNR